MVRPHRMVPAVLLLLLSCLIAQGAVGPSVSSVEPVGAAPPDLLKVWTSPNGQHVAYVVPMGSRVGVVFDGKTSQKFDEIVQFTEQYQYMATADLSHLAFLGRRGQNLFIVPDMVEVPLEPGSLVPPEAVFSANGKHFAFIMGPREGQRCVVLDGKPQEKYSRVSQLRFSADGSHFAYAAGNDTKTKAPNGQEILAYESFAVIDGKPGKKFEAMSIEGLTLSEDGKHHAYTGHSLVPATELKQGQYPHERWELIVDGASKVTANQILFVQMTANGKHVCCVTGAIDFAHKSLTNEAWYERSVWLDGMAWPYAYNGGQPVSVIPKPILSLTGERVAYVQPTLLANGGSATESVAVNGKSGSEYTKISDLRFNTDGAHVRYIAVQQAQNQGRSFVVEDENEAGPYIQGEFLDSRNVQLFWSPAHDHLAYIATEGETRVVVHDGKEVGRYRSIFFPVMSSDGKHFAFDALSNVADLQPKEVARYKQFLGDRPIGLDVAATILDGTPHPKLYELISDASLTISPDGRHSLLLPRERTAIARVDTELVRTEVPPCMFENGQFSADSKHVLFQYRLAPKAGQPSGSQRLLVDGIPLAGYGVLGRAQPMPDGTILAFALDEAKNTIVKLKISPGDGRGFGVGSADVPPGANRKK